FTVELWAKPKTFKDYRWLGGTELSQSPRAGWSMLAFGNGTVAYELWTPPTTDGGTNYSRSVHVVDKPLVADRFQQIVITYTGSVLSGYIDGTYFADGVAGGFGPDVGELRWGCRSVD